MADNYRLDGFLMAMKELKMANTVFPNSGDVEQCIADMLADIKQYKNIICTNDVIAILLLREMKKSGLETANYNITGSGNMKVGEYFNPSLTTMIGDYHNAGILAVEIYVFLSKKKLVNNLCVNMDCKIILRGSTHVKKHKITRQVYLEGETIDFYGDKSTTGIDRIEQMLVNCDDTDIGILHDVMSEKTYEDISEIHSLAVNTIKYRVKKMENHMNVKNRSEFIEYLKFFNIDI
jgi:hypothetical protein